MDKQEVFVGAAGGNPLKRLGQYLRYRKTDLLFLLFLAVVFFGAPIMEKLLG